MTTGEVAQRGDPTSEAPRDFISSQDVWSRRSLLRAGVSYGGILLLNSYLTETVLGGERSTDLTTLSLREAGDLVHGKAATAASRMGGAAKASIHVAAGAAAQAAYQLALARLAEDAASPFESKFRLFAAGRWPLGVVGSTLVLF